MALLWLAITAIATHRPPLNRQAIIGCLGVGLVLLGSTIGYLETSPVPASLLALAVALVLALWWALAQLLRWRARRGAVPSQEVAAVE